MAESADTKKVIDPRVEIDTSPPFESVKEAVDHFGGSGPWIPHHLPNQKNEAFDVEKIEEEAVRLERDLIMKEQQTLNVLKELEAAKSFVQGLKLNLIPELDVAWPSPGLMFSELNQAKLNLSKTASKMQLQETHHHVSLTVSSSKQSIGFEAEQYKKMTEASRYEVMEAMAEIERTKDCIRMAEMRLNAAKKMEEAAKAVEAIALARTNANQGDGITLSFEEYKALSQKAKQADQLCTTKFIDTPSHHLEVPVLEKFEDENNVVVEDSFAKFKFRNSQKPASIGDVLSSSRKVIVRDDVVVENQSEKQHVSLSQMLREQSRLILHPNKTAGEGNVQKQYFMQRKKFGFIQVPIPTKQSKKKSPAS
ncbi:WEB family protein At2g40480-like isoform X3 [Salvia miltiorrhiza]|uniref:WEB family protein At2g40480-like isoform X3 n=1 Tax=Salvia miltiorrhiza TaxID=226208 RepID=UPI0025ACD674|nr:WEB family protein At2g40480-like isoform X3 [Salvia miltiorrhiza]